MSLLGNLVGAAIITYFCSRLILLVLRRWSGGVPRLALAHVTSWLLITLVVAIIERYSLGAGWIYLGPQMFWLVIDMMRRAGRD